MRAIGILCLLIGSAWLAGCQNTIEGAREDAERNSEIASEKVTEAVEKAPEQARDLSAAARLTPVIKTALTANKELNDPDHLIDVDTTEETVRLSGHVKSESLKHLAGSIALKEIEKANGKQKLVNDLEVR